MSHAAECPPRYRWFDLVQMTGTEGRRWVAEYARVHPVVTQVLEPLEPLRKGDLRAGGELLRRAEELMESTHVEHESLRALMDRWYLGVAGYAHYAHEEYDAADACMRRAAERLRDALAAEAFLAAMADDVFELTLHRARIARNRMRWAEMWEHLETGAALREGRLAYGITPGGAPVMVGSLVDWFGALPVPLEAQPLVPHLQDPAERRRNTEGSLRAIVRLSGFVIPQP